VLVRVAAPSEGGGRTESREVVADVALPPELVPPAAVPEAAVESTVPDESPALASVGPELALTDVNEVVGPAVGTAASRTTRPTVEVADEVAMTDVCVSVVVRTGVEPVVTVVVASVGVTVLTSPPATLAELLCPALCGELSPVGATDEIERLSFDATVDGAELVACVVSGVGAGALAGVWESAGIWAFVVSGVSAG
jgi:hypothetical protein